MTVDEKQLERTKAIVKSMTREERLNPQVINASRRRRISAGSGTTVQDVNRLLNQFDQMKKDAQAVFRQRREAARHDEDAILVKFSIPRKSGYYNKVLFKKLFGGILCQ